jgi:hypothetical protein
VTLAPRHGVEVEVARVRQPQGRPLAPVA